MLEGKLMNRNDSANLRKINVGILPVTENDSSNMHYETREVTTGWIQDPLAPL